ncbi:hypothetical protein BJ508DRAFT_330653 [Ascobolus immersus RN42]|uniref:HNH nuclease domain-containing protein n=1 Tax=Ascobolus immersus RN42 TaxID=1160509 RepID=A0A3N4HWV0_ASCIM|nr:hypothetical protein BJ508DRAFT_330653 [Ascobolus immersus RN42]
MGDFQHPFQSPRNLDKEATLLLNQATTLLKTIQITPKAALDFIRTWPHPHNLFAAWFTIPDLHLPELVRLSALALAATTSAQRTALHTLFTLLLKACMFPPPTPPARLEEFRPAVRERMFATQVLLRDRGRDQLTGRLSHELSTLQAENPRLFSRFDDLPTQLDPAEMMYTRCANILRFSCEGWNESKETARHQQRQAWKMLEFVFPNIFRFFPISDINTTRNGLTLNLTLAGYFTSFDIGFAHISGDTYELLVFDTSLNLAPPIVPAVDNDGNTRVTFRYAEGTREGEKVWRELMRLHLVLCRLVHSEGVEEVVGADEDAGVWERECERVRNVGDGKGWMERHVQWLEVRLEELANSRVEGEVEEE